MRGSAGKSMRKRHFLKDHLTSKNGGRDPFVHPLLLEWDVGQATPLGREIALARRWRGKKRGTGAHEERYSHLLVTFDCMKNVFPPQSAYKCRNIIKYKSYLPILFSKRCIVIESREK